MPLYLVDNFEGFSNGTSLASGGWNVTDSDINSQSYNNTMSGIPEGAFCGMVEAKAIGSYAATVKTFNDNYAISKDGEYLTVWIYHNLVGASDEYLSVEGNSFNYMNIRMEKSGRILKYIYNSTYNDLGVTWSDGWFQHKFEIKSASSRTWTHYRRNSEGSAWTQLATNIPMRGTSGVKHYGFSFAPWSNSKLKKVYVDKIEVFVHKPVSSASIT